VSRLGTGQSVCIPSTQVSPRSSLPRDSADDSNASGCAMILLRGIFRTIEFGSGNNSRGYFLDNEGWCTSYSPPTPQNLLMRCMNRLRTRNAAHPHLRVPLPLFSPLALHSFRPQGPTAPRGGDSTHRSEPRSQEIPGRRPRVEVRRSLVPFLLPYSATSSPPPFSHGL
jgi:hypothetical protein